MKASPSRNDRFVALAIVALGCAYLLWIFRNTWFFGDEWAVIATRRDLWAQGHKGLAVFRPHTDHWVTLPVLLYFAMFKLFSLSSYLPYLGMVIFAHGCTAFGLHELWRRMDIRRLPAFGGLVLFTLFGAGAENLSWAFQITIVASIGLGVAQVLAVTAPTVVSPSNSMGRRGRLAQMAGPVLGGLNIMTSGMAFPMLLCVAAVLVVQRRYRHLATNIGLPAIMYVCWYLTYGNEPRPSLPSRPGLFAAYIERGVFSSLEAVTFLTGAGAILALVLVACLTKWWPRRETHALQIAGVVTGFGMYALFAVGRAGLGAEQAAQSRYLYASASMLIGPLLLGPVTLLSSRHLQRGLVASLLCWSIIGNVSALTIYRDHRLVDVDFTRTQIQSAAALPTLALLDRDAIVESRFSPDLLVGTLADFVMNGHLKATKRAPTQATVNNEAELSIRFTQSTAPSNIPLRFITADTSYESDNRPDCFRTMGEGAHLTFFVERPGMFTVRPVNAATIVLPPVEVRLIKSGLASEPVLVPIPNLAVQRLRIATYKAEISITVPAHPFEICGVSELFPPDK